MAKIKYSALVSDMRNKLNGSVLSKNRYGSYVRNKTTPVNPQSSYQQQARSILATLSSGWRGITEAARASWNALAKELPFTDIFGDIKYLTGSALYVKLNTNLINAGQASSPTAPAPVGLPEVLLEEGTATITAGAITELSVDFNVASMPADHVVAIYATPVIGAGQEFIKNRLRFVGPLTTITANSGNILALYTARFGTVMPVGSKIFVRAAVVNTVTGQMGIPTQLRLISA